MTLYTVSTGNTIQAQDLNQFQTYLEGYIYNVKDYGCKVDGSTDDSTAFTNCYTAAGATGGIVTGLNGGTLIKGNDTIQANVIVDLQGGTIKLKNGANTDLFSGQTSSINLAASQGSGSTGTLYRFGFKNGILDGNNANQSSGTSYPLRFYGFAYLLENLEIRKGYTGGFLSDWNGPSSTGLADDLQMEARISNLRVHANNGMGFQFGGPHDSQLHNVISYNNNTHSFHFAPNAVSCQVTNLHAYSCASGLGGIACLCEASACAFINSEFEGGDVGQFAALADDIQIIGGRIFIPVGANVWGLKIGQQASETPITGQILQSGGVTTAATAQYGIFECLVTDCNGTHGGVWFDNDTTGGNYLSITHHNNTNISTGTPSANTSYFFRTDTSSTMFVNGHIKNAILDASATGGVGIQTTPNSNIALLIDPGADANNGITVYGHSATQSGTLIKAENSSYASVWQVNPTGSMQVQGAATMFSGSGAPSGSVGAVGDFYFRTDTPSTSSQRLYIKTGTSTWTGIV